MNPRGKTEPNWVAVAAAFGVVYLVWGSTYLAIRYAIEGLPPFAMAGLRFAVAGAMMLPFSIRAARALPTLRQWRSAAYVGGLMLVGGNGLVVWSEQYVPSGVAALFVATVPLWFALLDWLLHRGSRPTWRVVAGLATGLLGIYLLIGPSSFSGARVHPWGAAALLMACVFWAFGSLQSKKAALPASPFLSTAMQMTAAGFWFIVLSGASGEWSRLDLAAVSLRSWLSIAYLILFGSILALTCYVWLLQVCPATKVATYAYVNPVIAVLLGAALAGEALSPRVLAASTIIVAAVVLITTVAPVKTPVAVRFDSTAPVAGRALDLEPSRISLSSRPSRCAAPRTFDVDVLAAACERLGLPYFEFLRHGGLSMGVYVLRAGEIDRQQPHAEDEVYYVLEGRARFIAGDEEHRAGPGSIFVVPRGVAHRYCDIEEDLRILVFFTPAEGSLATTPEEELLSAC